MVEKLEKKGKCRVLLTWDAPWENEIPEGVEIVQIPLTQTRSIECRDLKTNFDKILTSSLTCFLFFSKAGIQGFIDNFEGKSLPKNVKIATVGASTKKEVEKAGFEVDHVGSSTGLTLVKTLHEMNFADQYIMLSGNLGGGDVEHFFFQEGVSYRKFVVYENSQPEGVQEVLPEVLKTVDLICLASPSAAERLIAGRDPQKLPKLLSIGPVTTRRIEALGANVYWQSPRPGYHSFLTGISEYLTK